MNVLMRDCLAMVMAMADTGKGKFFGVQKANHAPRGSAKSLCGLGKPCRRRSRHALLKDDLSRVIRAAQA